MVILYVVSGIIRLFDYKRYDEHDEKLKAMIMTIKKKIAVFIIVILAITSFGIFKENFQNKKNINEFNNWLNGWISNLIEMRKTYSLKLDSIQIVELHTPDDYWDINKMKAFKGFLGQILEVELWKIDKGLEIDNIWSKKLDSKLNEKYPEQFTFLKDQINKGDLNANEFRLKTINYVNDQVSFINFLLEKKCILVQSDEMMYNNFSSKIENSSKIYRDAVNDFYSINIQRVKNFNLHFKNENIDKLIDIIPDGVINGK